MCNDICTFKLHYVQVNGPQERCLAITSKQPAAVSSLDIMLMISRPLHTATVFIKSHTLPCCILADFQFSTAKSAVASRVNLSIVVVRPAAIANFT